MSIVLSFAIISVSFIMAYIRYKELDIIYRKNRFFCNLACALIENNSGEMRSSFDIINAEIKKFALDNGSAPPTRDTVKNPLPEREFISSIEFEKFLDEDFKDAVNINIIKDVFLKYLKSGADELSEIGSALKEVTESAALSAKSRLEKVGKAAFVIYPSIAAMAILIVM